MVGLLRWDAGTSSSPIFERVSPSVTPTFRGLVDAPPARTTRACRQLTRRSADGRLLHHGATSASTQRSPCLRRDHGTPPYTGHGGVEGGPARPVPADRASGLGRSNHQP